MKRLTINKRTGSIVKALAFLCCLLVLDSTPAYAQAAPGSIGLGGQIGEPSGITLKIYHPRSLSYDFLAAWDFDDFFFLNVHGLYERRLNTTQRMHFFFGPGGFIGFRERSRNRDDDIVIGISGTFGLNIMIEQFEIYLQLTPRFALIPETDGDMGGGLGFRYYF